jgi:hypothetical protein
MRCFLAALLIARYFLATDLARAAESMNYVVLLPGQTCSIDFDDANIPSIRSFRILAPIGALDDLAKKAFVINAHVCECFLLPGDPRQCAAAVISKAARPLRLTQAEEMVLGGRIFVLVNDQVEFIKLYGALNATYPRYDSGFAWTTLRRVSQEIATNSSGAGAVSPPNGPAPPAPPAGSASTGDSDTNDKDKERHCELETNLCVNPATRDPSAEFELKCKGLPTVIFSTDGKAGLKIGPVEVSLSANGEKAPTKR